MYPVCTPRLEKMPGLDRAPHSRSLALFWRLGVYYDSTDRAKQTKLEFGLVFELPAHGSNRVQNDERLRQVEFA